MTTIPLRVVLSKCPNCCCGIEVVLRIVGLVRHWCLCLGTRVGVVDLLKLCSFLSDKTDPCEIVSHVLGHLMTSSICQLPQKDMSALERYQPIVGYAPLGGRAAFRAEHGRCSGNNSSSGPLVIEQVQYAEKISGFRSRIRIFLQRRRHPGPSWLVLRCSEVLLGLYGILGSYNAQAWKLT